MPPKGNRGRGRGRGRPRTRSQGDTENRSSPRADTSVGAMDMDRVADIIAQQITAAMPTIVAQVNANRNMGASGSAGTTENDDRDRPESSKDKPTGCNYKSFMGCKPKDFYGNEGTIKALRWIDEMEAIVDISNCAEKDQVRFVSHSFKDEALEWWNTIIQARGRDVANRMSWTEFTHEFISKYCPQNEMEKLQTEFLSLSMDGKNILKYTQKFNALARLLPNLVTPESQKVNRFIWGLDSRVRGLVKASQPTTMKSAIELAAIVTDDRVRSGEFDPDNREVKRKAEENKKHVVYAIEGHERKKDRKKQKNTEGDVKTYQGTNPWCAKCKWHHHGECKVNVCSKCKLSGHMAKDCRARDGRKCHECGSADHLHNVCPKLEGNKNHAGGTRN